MAEASKKQKIKILDIGTLRLFVIWGILESTIFMITKGDQYKSLLINLIIFTIINIAIYIHPQIDFY